MKNARFLMLILVLVALAACQLGGPKPEEVAQTMVAQTAAAASPTPIPTDTPVPTATPTLTSTPLPTDTPTATNTSTSTPTATNTPLPTDTPTITPTPGPIVFKDDFSTQDEKAWRCDGCKWEDGKLIIGPYKPADGTGPFTAVCEACGSAKYYRVAVDATFTDGYNDRFFGLLFGANKDNIHEFGICTLYQLAIVAKYDFNLQQWKLLNVNPDNLFNGMVKAGFNTNHIEVTVKPSGADGQVDYYIGLNGKTSFIIYGRPVQQSKVGLLVDFHSMEVTYDNFEYEEIWVK